MKELTKLSDLVTAEMYTKPVIRVMFIFQIIILPCCKEITHLQDVGINQK
jgi:hypothetical protein